MNEIVLPAALPHQTPVLDHPARFKVWRAGRRTGKSRAAVIASIAGHGPQRALKGVLQGGDIVWLSPDYPQSKAIWREEIKPRLSGLPFVEVHETSKRVEIQGLGSLELRSAESIDGIRGRKLHGVIVDEAGYQDLEYAWTAVIRPALADHQGWAMFISTPNAGQDGNSLKRAPSYFNILCEKAASGEMGQDWQHFHNKTGDNQKLAREEVASLYAEYPEGSTVVQQELDALLIVGGAGLAFPEFKRSVHQIPSRQPPRHWRWAAAMDWGYRQGSYGLYALGPEGEVEKVWEYYEAFKGKHAKEAAKAIIKASEHFPQPEYIAADEQMWQEVGVSMTLAEEFNQGMSEYMGGLHNCPMLQKAEHKPGSRVTKKNLMHRYLAYTSMPDGSEIPPWHQPRLRIQERCRDTVRTMESLPLDEKKLEDVDTDAEDHAYDETCMLLSSRPPLTTEFKKGPAFDMHPGWTESGIAKDMVRDAEEDQGYSVPQYRLPTEWSER